ncbi:ExeM/NucH family extracellular endonuclease [Thioalkalicoccus limnaeus]|uniref:ExeM/NucH family extracellular endonuclease n=1 Tax=Thioalkalicoccus limnaeus TaxID=120681 RepID=A0ABV4BE94_9GAMM
MRGTRRAMQTTAAMRVIGAAFVCVLLSVPARADCPLVRTVPLADLRAGLIAEGQAVVVEAVVTGAFAGRERLGGFFIQQGTPPVGSFVYAPSWSGPVPRRGHRIQVDGRFVRFRGRGQISQVTDIRDCGRVGLPDPVDLFVPADAKRFVDHLDVEVRFPQVLTVTGNQDLARYGTLALSAHGRLFRPWLGAVEPAEDRSAHRIWLDDGRYRMHPDPIPYLDGQGTRRTGDQVVGLTGILTHAFGAYRVHPTEAPRFIAANPRPPPPPPPDQARRLAAVNLENYFVTLGQRGASSRTELARQRRKLAAVFDGLDADLIAVSEVENRRAALLDLVTQLNAGLPSSRQYRALEHPYPGDDAIKVALLYRPDRLTWVGSAADADPVHRRPPLLGWFRAADEGPLLGIVTVHFKSKTGCPERDDLDQGQGCWNRLRTAQAERLVAWLASIRKPGDAITVAGDLNAYPGEAPIRFLETADLRHLIADHWPASQRYTYVFRGEAGQLDYLLGDHQTAAQVLRGGIWHINADEPAFLGYQGRRPAHGPWRSSDHDPLWVDLDVGGDPRVD